jgi:hypothetical protein
MNGFKFRPKVFKESRFILIVGEPGTDRMKKLRGV